MNYRNFDKIQTKIVEIDPNKQCGDIIVTLLHLFTSENTNIKNDDFEYGLYFYPDMNDSTNSDWPFESSLNFLEEKDRKSLFLEDTEPIAKYTIKNRKVIIKIK